MKNIIIFVAVAIAFVLIYIFFIKSSGEEANLVSTGANGTMPTVTTSNDDALATKDFLTVLLSVKSIKLDDSIFSDIAFTTLNDSNVVLTPDGTEGRANPFAPLGSESTYAPTANPTTIKTTPSPATPASNPSAPTVN